MVLTSPRREKRLRALATVAVSSGGRSSFGVVVPVNLFASREKEQAHELLGNERNRKQLLTRRVTLWNGVATEKAHGDGLGQSWGRKEGSGDWAGKRMF